MTCPDYIDDLGGGGYLQRMQAELKSRVVLPEGRFLSAWKRRRGIRSPNANRIWLSRRMATDIDSLEVWLLPLTIPMKPLA
jgi:hypothetical protein